MCLISLYISLKRIRQKIKAFSLWLTSCYLNDVHINIHRKYDLTDTRAVHLILGSQAFKREAYTTVFSEL